MLQLNFHPFPILRTKRLILREISLSDLDDLFQLRNDVNAMKYIGKSLPFSREETVNLLNRIMEGYRLNSAIGWGITLKGNNKLVGNIGYHIIDKDHYRAEIGYILIPDLWHQGIMSEAIQDVLNYGFDIMKLHSVEARIDPENEKSKGLLKKFNFISEGYLRESFLFNGQFMDTEVFSLLAKK